MYFSIRDLQNVKATIGTQNFNFKQGLSIEASINGRNYSDVFEIQDFLNADTSYTNNVAIVAYSEKENKNYPIHLNIINQTNGDALILFPEIKSKSQIFVFKKSIIKNLTNTVIVKAKKNFLTNRATTYSFFAFNIITEPYPDPTIPKG